MFLAGEFAHIKTYFSYEVFHDLVTETRNLLQQLYRIVILGEYLAYLCSQLAYQDCGLVNIASYHLQHIHMMAFNEACASFQQFLWCSGHFAMIDTLYILKGNELTLT